MDPSSHGRQTRSQSQSRPPPPPPEGTAYTPFVGTPPHCTDKPWTEVVKKGATTPLTAARASPKPNHPFETTNQFTTLHSTHDSTDDGSGQSDDILLMPADGAPPSHWTALAILPLMGQLQLRRTTPTPLILLLHRTPRGILPLSRMAPLHCVAPSQSWKT
jgi:hypothetical protein